MDFEKKLMKYPQFENTKNDIEKIIENLSEKENEEFWNSIGNYYEKLKRKIIKTNKKNYKYLNEKISKRLEKGYDEDIRTNLKLLNEAFPELIDYTKELISKNSQLDTSFQCEFYLTSDNKSSIASIIEIRGKVVIVLNRNAISLFEKNEDFYSVIILHEIAHIEQIDTQYLLKKYILKNKFFSRFTLLYYKRVRWQVFIIFGIFLFFFIPYILKPNPTDLDWLTFRIEARRAIKHIFKKLAIFIIPALYYAYRIKRNTKKKNRLLSEFGADVFSLIKSRSLSLIHFLQQNAIDKNNSEIHWDRHTRIEKLNSLMAYIYLSNEEKLKKHHSFKFQ